MDNINHINKLITYLFFTGLCLSLIFAYFAQERLFSEITYGELSLGPERYIRSLSVIFIFIAVSLNLFVSENKYSPIIFISYFLILGPIILNYIITGPKLDDLTGFMDSKGIGPWICFGLIFMSFDEYRYNAFKKFLIVSVIVFSAYTFYNLIEYGIGLYRGQALSKYRIYATNLVWISPYVFLIYKKNKRLIIFRVFALFIGISTALITQTRSFLVIYILILVFDFFQTKRKNNYVIAGFIVGLIFIYIIVNTESFRASFDFLQQRGINDTRSNQLIEFLSQVKFFELIVGKGFYATWYFGGYPYNHLDNQWILLLWWAGLIPTLMYFYLTAIIPVKLFISKKMDYETKVESFILIIWTLACAGLAIYTTMSVDFYFYIICVIQGRLLYKYGMKSDYR